MKTSGKWILSSTKNYTPVIDEAI